MNDTVTITRPDDWHIHLRDGAALGTTVDHVVNHFARAIVMPNLVPPVDNLKAVRAYRQRIIDRLKPGQTFNPLMTLYVTPDLAPATVIEGAAAEEIVACKLYPARATTNAQSGIENLTQCYPLFEAMEAHDIPLLVHAETTDVAIDVFDREAVFLDRDLQPLVEKFPQLRVVVEHVTTAQGVDFVYEHRSHVAATITAHHLMYDRNDLINTRIQPHLFCLPVLKRNEHQQALIAAATGGSGQFFFGSDSAPHVCESKQSAHGCAGVYTAPVAMAMLATVFEQANALSALEGFVSHFGPDFYQLPRNEETITLQKQPWQVPDHYHFSDSVVVPACAGETLHWQVV